MKNLVTFVALAVIGLCIWRYHNDKVSKVAAKAAEEARAEALASKPKAAKPARLQAVGISRMLEEWHTDLFSDLSTSRPLDLVPPLTIARERILDSKVLVESEKHHIYDIALNLLARMIVAAEVRTKTLEIMLQAEMNGRNSLDSVNTASASRTFLAQSSVRRWDETKRQVRPPIDQLFANLRQAEREWNQKAGKGARVDSYDFGSLVPLNISGEARKIGGSSLEQKAYNQTQAWRRAYYDRYSGQPVYR